MKRVVISARQFIADLRARVGDATLMEKYNLSPSTLLNLKKELLDRRLITPNDIRPSSEPPRPNRKALNAKQFAQDFRENPDDYYLMDRYSLTPSELRTVYRRLIERGVLSEYEFHMRDVAAPELGEASILPTSATALVTAVEGTTRVSAPPRRGHHDLPQDFYRDFSGIKLRSTSQEPIDRDKGAGKQEKEARKEQSTVVLLTSELCPKCQRPKDDPMDKSCPYCGIVYAKVRRGRRPETISVWSNDKVE